MRPMQTTPIPTSSNPTERAVPILTSRARDFITTRLARGDRREQIAAGLRAYFDIEIDPAQVIPLWNGEILLPTQTGHRQDDKESVQFPADAEKEPLFTVMAPDETQAVTSEAAPAPFSIASDPAPVCDDADGKAGEGGETTQTGHRQDEEESLQIPADTVDEPTSHDNSLDALGAFVKARLGIAPDPAQTTRTGPGQESESHESLPAEVREFIIGRMARRDPPWLIANDVESKFGFVVDRDEIIVCWRDRDASPTPTRTGPGQEKESRPRLTDEVKEFIVKRLACYETPSRIAAAVRINFGIDIDRRRVHEYNPKGSRPPAQRWIDLHAATRARFLRDVAEIGVAQKVVRLRALDRFAEMAEDNNRHDKAAKYLEQAARECGGFYERFQRPKGGAATEDASAS